MGSSVENVSRGISGIFTMAYKVYSSQGSETREVQ